MSVAGALVLREVAASDTVTRSFKTEPEVRSKCPCNITQVELGCKVFYPLVWRLIPTPEGSINTLQQIESECSVIPP